MIDGVIPSSFRDPMGFIFFKEGICYRQVNPSYKENYDYLIDSGLYKKLTEAELLIPHEEVEKKFAWTTGAYKTLRPTPIPFISYPYEWSFSQLKDAALTTLEIQKIAIEHGMSLKDANAYNLQFYKGKPVLIDTLSFEMYQDKKPWAPYQQFCRFFVAPLALMSYIDIRMSQLLRIYLDGIPLDLASSLLPWKTRFKPALFIHIHLHAKYQKRHSSNSSNTFTQKTMGIKSLLGLVDNLESYLKNSNWKPKGTEWIDYYSKNEHASEFLENKTKIVEDFLKELNPKTIWDLGANVGVFSRIASSKNIPTISFDIDPACIETSYLQTIKKKETNLLPLWLDLNNPSPGIGWENDERMSLLERGPTDTVFALALIHHLAISNNLTLQKIAEFFSKICRSLIIEFIPKNDSMIQRLLSTRKDIFTQYTQNNFEIEFTKFFKIIKSEKIKPLDRTLYLMKRK